MADGKDRVWIGNLGKHNEGTTTGAWLELPYDEHALGDWLREHVGIGEPRWDGGVYEEYWVDDADFCGRLGELSAGKLVGTWALLSTLNAAAQIAASLQEDVLEDVKAYIEADGVGNLDELCNVMLQADDICAWPLAQKKWFYSSEREAAARNIDLGVLVGDDDKTMRRHISAEKVGESYGEGGYFSGDVWLDSSCAGDIDDELCREDLIAGETHGGLTAAAKRAGASSMEEITEIAKGTMKSCGFFGESKHGDIDALAKKDPKLFLACANTIADIADYGNEDAVCAYVEGCLPASYGVTEVASVVQQAERLVFRELEPAWDKSDAEKLGEAIIKEQGVDSFSHEDLMEYFDEEDYAHDLIVDGDITVTDGFILNNGATEVDLDKYDHDEIVAEGADRARMLSRASELTAQGNVEPQMNKEGEEL